MVGRSTIIKKDFMGRLPCVKENGLMLISVVVIGAISTAVAVALILFGLGAFQSSAILTQSDQARALADSCAEEGLYRVKLSENFSGSGSLVDQFGSCEYSVLNLGGASRLVAATGTVQSVVRKVRVILDQINPRIRISSWQEVAD